MPEFTTWKILTTDGDVVMGYRVDSTEQAISLKDPASGKTTTIAQDDIEEENVGGTLMPVGLTAALTRQQQLDLIRFLSDLGRNGQSLSAELHEIIA